MKSLPYLARMWWLALAMLMTGDLAEPCGLDDTVEEEAPADSSDEPLPTAVRTWTPGPSALKPPPRHPAPVHEPTPLVHPTPPPPGACAVVVTPGRPLYERFQRRLIPPAPAAAA